MPKVGSRYSKFGFEKHTHKKNAFGFEKNPAELGFLGSISQTRRKCIYERWTTGAGWGGEALRLFYDKHVLAILKTCSIRLELRNHSRMFTNL